MKRLFVDRLTFVSTGLLLAGVVIVARAMLGAKAILVEVAMLVTGAAVALLREYRCHRTREQTTGVPIELARDAAMKELQESPTAPRLPVRENPLPAPPRAGRARDRHPAPQMHA